MSDEEKLNLEDVGAGTEEAEAEAKKAGFLPSVIIKFLKWAAIGLGFIILGATTTVITFKMLNKGRTNPDFALTSTEYRATEPLLEWDDSIESIRGVTSDEVPAIFTVGVSLGYEGGNNRLTFELNARRRQIQNIIFILVSNKNRDELKPDKYKNLQEELKEQINRIMREGRIKSVVFREFVVTQ